MVLVIQKQGKMLKWGKAKVKISVVVVTYNAEDKIGITLDSFLNQNIDFDVAECVVIDGCSKDHTIETVKKYCIFHKNIKLFVEEDDGIYDAMNKCLRCSSGEYILFLGAGDTFASDSVLKNVVEQAKCDIVYGYVYMKDMSNNAFKYIVKLDFIYTFRFSPISHQAVFARRSLFNSYKFDMAYKIAADQDWIMRCYKNGCTTQFIDVAICNFDMNGISGTDSGKQLYLQEKQLIQKTYYPVRCAIHRLGQNMKEKLGIR